MWQTQRPRLNWRFSEFITGPVQSGHRAAKGILEPKRPFARTAEGAPAERRLISASAPRVADRRAGSPFRGESCGIITHLLELKIVTNGRK